MLLLFTPRQPGLNATIVHTQIIHHIVAHHGSAPINRCEGSTIPLPSKAQNSNTYCNQLISPTSWAGSRGVQHVMQFLSKSGFSKSISVRLLQVCEITLFLKTLLSIMMTRAKIHYTLRFRLRQIL